MNKACCPKPSNNLTAHLGSEQSMHLLRRNLNAGDCIVIPNPVDPETQFPQGALALRHLGEAVRRDLGPVRKPARQTSQGRLIPDRQINPTGRLTDITLGESNLVEWRAHAMFARGLAPGTVVAPVVDVEAVKDVWNPQPPGLFNSHAVQFSFAEIAAIYRIPGVAGIIELMRFDKQMARPKLFGQALRGGFFIGSKTRGNRCECHSVLSQNANRFGE
jgi:hypothetical protein